MIKFELQFFGGRGGSGVRNSTATARTKSKTATSKKSTARKATAEEKAIAVNYLNTYGKNGKFYTRKEATAAVKAMSPRQIQTLNEKAEAAKKYFQKVVASSDATLKRMYKTATPEEKQRIRSHMSTRGYIYEDGKWYDRATKRGYNRYRRGLDKED